MSKPVKECNKGEKCEYHKVGQCKFGHTKTMLKAQPAKKTVVKTHPAKIEMKVVRQYRTAFAPKLLKLQDSIKRATALHDYVKVDGKDAKDQKGLKKESWADMSEELGDLQQQFGLLKSAARAIMGRSHVKTTLYYSGSGAAGAGFAYPSSFGLQPSACSEFASYAVLYDEIRVTAIKVHYVITCASANLAENCFYALGYDSTYNSTPSNVLDVMESTQHELGAVSITVPGNSSALTATPTGVRTFHISIPKQPVANAASVTGGTGIVPNFPGEWMAAGDTADTVGFLRIFIERGGGTTATVAISYKIEFECEWRERT